MGRKKRKKIIQKTIKLTFCLILIALLSLSIYYILDIGNEIKGDDVKGEEVTFEIVSGDSASSVTAKLKEMGLIKYENIFKFLSRMENLERKIQIGTYTINMGSSYDEIFEKLKSNTTYRATVRITFTEGSEVQDIFKTLVANGIGTMDRYEQVAKGWDFGYSFLPDIGSDNRLEGFLYPDTYDFFADEKEESVIKRFLDNFNKKMTDAGLWEKISQSGETIYDTLKLASIIEKESQYQPELSTISSVFHNRLDIRMMLQSDASVNYILDKDDRYSSISASTMAIDSPYNTYKYYGLTPTPICNPSIQSITAAVEPADTEYLYFCSKGDGSHVFAYTYEEHLKNVKTYLG